MNKKLFKIAIGLYIVFLFFANTNLVLAKGEPLKYKPLTDLPIFTKDAEGFVSNPDGLVSGIYIISIGIGSILAVVMITIAGIKYMTTGAVTGKTDAKKQVEAALYGLILLLSSYLILKTINAKLVTQEIKLSTPNLNISNVSTSNNSGTGGPTITKVCGADDTCQ